MYVNLNDLPDPPSRYQAVISGLYAGLNTSRIPSEIGDGQCADLLNMIWKNGVLRSRDGQVVLPVNNETVWQIGDSSVSYSPDNILPLNVFESVWHNRIVFACTEEENEVGYIVSYNIKTGVYERVYKVEETGEQMVSWYAGSFFRFGNDLYYKNRNTYVRLTVEDSEQGEVVRCVPVVGYVPVIMINTNSDGVGDLYQPENRLSKYKEVWYNGDSGVRYEEFACDGKTMVFRLSVKLKKKDLHYQDGTLRSVQEVYIGPALGSEGTDYSVDYTNGVVTILGQDAPGIGLKVTVKYLVSKCQYTLPVSEVDGIESVYVKDLTSGTYVQYTQVSGTPGENEFSVSGNVITFDTSANTAPDSDANVLNTFIKVVYEKENPEAYAAIDDCHIVQVYGVQGIESNCIVMAGCEQQDNAYFWSGNDSNGANPAYFPIDQYNLVGMDGDSITAFGRQQNKLVIFQKNRISSAEYGMDTVDGRVVVTLNAKGINDHIGCDLPRSVQLVNNNLVWANSKLGVMYLKDSTYAYEHLVVCISNNINEDGHGTDYIGLRSVLERANWDDLNKACSMDDGQRYWLFLNGRAYLWDYSIVNSVSDPSKLSWFVCDNINISGSVIDGNTVYHLSSVNHGDEGQSEQWLIKFDETEYTDFGAAFRKVVQPKTQIFRTYSNMKNVRSAIFTFDSSRKMKNAALKYITDYGVRQDLRPLDNLLESSKEQRPDAIRVRAPKCNHVHHFAIRLESNDPSDLNLISVQIFYTYARQTKSGLKL